MALCRKPPSVPVLRAFIGSICDIFRSHAALQVEILALRHRHHLGVLQRSVKRPRLTKTDRFFWAWLSQVWPDWRSVIVLVKPETVLAWQRKLFWLFWTWKVRHGRLGRPTVSKEVRDLVRTMSRANPLWGVRLFIANC